MKFTMTVKLTQNLRLFKLSLERETGIINGGFSDDVLFLRQLILDGQWDSALDFVEPLKELPEFNFRIFRYYITKYKYFELLCLNQEPGIMHDNDFTVQVCCYFGKILLTTVLY